MFFYFCYIAESCCKFRESFFFCSFSKTIIHIGPFIIFAFCGMKKILCCISYTI